MRNSSIPPKTKTMKQGKLRHPVIIFPPDNSQKSTNRLRVFYQNTRGLNSKTLEFYLNVLSEDYDVIALVETWLTSGVNTGELFDSRYQVFRQDRDPYSTEKSKGGGLIIAIRNNIKALPLTSLNQCERHLESLWVKCNIHGQDIILSLCYFPPPVKCETMETFAEAICQKEELLGNKMICLGDYNIPNFHPPGIDPNIFNPPSSDIHISGDPVINPTAGIDTSGDPDINSSDINPTYGINTSGEPDINPLNSSIDNISFFNPDIDPSISDVVAAGDLGNSPATPDDDGTVDPNNINPDIEARGALMHLHKVINFYDLDSLNTVRNHKGRTLDLCLTNFNSNKITRKKFTNCYIKEADGLVKIDSHHPPLILYIETNKSKDLSSYTRTSPSHSDMPFNFNKTNFETLNEKLSSNNWYAVYNAPSPNDKMKMFYDELNKAFLLSTPLLNNNPNKDKFPKWWQKNTIHTFKRKERIRKIHRKTTTQKSEYTKLRKLCKAEIKKDYENYINKVTFLVKKGNSKPFWDFTKQQSKEPPKKILKYKDEQISEPQHIVDAFAEHFKNAYNQTPPNYTTDYSIDTDPEHFHLSTITEQDIEYQIKQMSINKPPGPDGIPPKILSKCLAHLKAPLAHIFTHSIKTGIFPSALKVSNVTPVPKKSGDLNVNMHRPVSNLNVLQPCQYLVGKISFYVFAEVLANTIKSKKVYILCVQ
uniref:Endonuclease/exonuclease/phosphatase domain-containing protein n=1 Tax=Cacopsylla melanoneura TaxID=428564 RepID=A0A8D8Z6R9_9HEMI